MPNPVPFSLNDHNIGIDASATFQFDTGQTVPAEQLAHVMSISAKKQKQTSEKKPISKRGKKLRRTTPDGYMVTMKFLRHSGNLTAVVAKMDADFYATGRPSKFAYSLTVRNPQGGIDRYLFTECDADEFDVGLFEANEGVEQEWSFWAQEMLVK